MTITADAKVALTIVKTIPDILTGDEKAMFTFHVLWNAKQVLTDAAREGALLAVVGDPTIILESQVTDRVKEKIARGGFDASQVEVEYPDGFHEGTGEITSVQVSMPYRFVVLHRLASLVTDNGVISAPDDRPDAQRMTRGGPC